MAGLGCCLGVVVVAGWVGRAGFTAGLVDGDGVGAVAGFAGEAADLAAGVGAGVAVTGLALGAAGAAAAGFAGGMDWAVWGGAGFAAWVASGLGSVSPLKCSLSLPLMASRMKSIQMGRATRAPCSLSPRDWRLS